MLPICGNTCAWITTSARSSSSCFFRTLSAPRRFSSPGHGPSSRRMQSHCSPRSEEHTSELQSLRHLVCRLLLEKKKKNTHNKNAQNHHNPRTQHSKIGTHAGHNKAARPEAVEDRNSSQTTPHYLYHSEHDHKHR